MRVVGIAKMHGGRVEQREHERREIQSRSLLAHTV
jgi:hypothetical protein